MYRASIRTFVLAFTAPLAWAGEVQLIPDRHFQNGFQLRGANPLAQLQDTYLGLNPENGPPYWQLGEWWSNNTLVGAAPQLLPSGATKYETSTKSIVVGPEHVPEGHLTTSMNAILEFGGVEREPGADWPHLLVEQVFSNAGIVCPPLDEVHALPFSVDVRVLKDELYQPEGYNFWGHAAQFLLYFIVQNRHTHDFLWFGIQFYDNRYPMPELVTFPADLGSGGLGKYIYNPAKSNFTSVSTHSGDWVRFEANLLPLVEAALQSAWNDERLLESQNLADYHIPYMNMGLELTGLHDFSSQVRNLSLIAVADRIRNALHFNFNEDTERWVSHTGFASVTASGGMLQAQANTQNPALIRRDIYVDTATIDRLYLRMRVSNSSSARLHWRSLKDPTLSITQSEPFDLVADGVFHEYVIDLSDNPNWQDRMLTEIAIAFTGLPSGLEIDYIIAPETAAGDVVYVDYRNTGIATGTPHYPYPTLIAGLHNVDNAGTIRVAEGAYAEQLQITQSVRLEAHGGPARIGVAGNSGLAMPAQISKHPDLTSGAAPEQMEIGAIAALLAANFAEADLDGDGILSPEELRHFLRTRGIAFTEETIAALLAVAPRSGGVPGPIPLADEGPILDQGEEGSHNTRAPQQALGCRDFLDGGLRSPLDLFKMIWPLLLVALALCGMRRPQQPHL